MITLPLHVLLELVEVAVTFIHTFSPDDHIHRGDLVPILRTLCLVNEVKIKICVFFLLFQMIGITSK